MQSEKRPDPFTPTSTPVSLSPTRIAATHRCFAVRNGTYTVFSRLIYYQNMRNCEECEIQGYLSGKPLAIAAYANLIGREPNLVVRF
jgi:hypothetical protein